MPDNCNSIWQDSNMTRKVALILLQSFGFPLLASGVCLIVLGVRELDESLPKEATFIVGGMIAWNVGITFMVASLKLRISKLLDRLPHNF